MMMRVCRKCGIEKPLDQFIAAPKCKLGRTHECKVCRLEYDRALKLKKRPLESRPREIARRLFVQGFRKCLGCEGVKPLTEYWKNSRWPNGYNARCKPCYKAKLESNPDRAAYYKAYDSRPDIFEKKQGQRKRRAQKTPRHVMQITLRHGLRRRPTEIPATVDDLMLIFEQQERRCAISGLKLTWAQGKVTPTSISLDRINPDGGYSKDNLRLVCQAVNAFRGRMTDAEMLTMARAIVDNMSKNSREPSWQPHIVSSEAA